MQIFNASQNNSELNSELNYSETPIHYRRFTFEVVLFLPLLRTQ